MISLFGKSCQGQGAIFPPLSSAACRPGTAASGATCEHLQCALSFCYTKSVGSCSFPWSHAPHTDLCGEYHLLTLPPEGDYWLLCFLSLPFPPLQPLPDWPLFRGWVFSTKSKRGEYGRGEVCETTRNSKNAESRLGNVLTALQILIHLIFTISWTWCIVVFLFFYLHERSDIDLGLTGFMLEMISFKSQTCTEMKALLICLI